MGKIGTVLLMCFFKKMITKRIIYTLAIVLLLTSCSDYISVDGIHISTHLCEIAKENYGVNYANLLEESLEGNDDSIKGFVSLSFDGAYAYEHGEIIVELIDRIGSEQFLTTIETLNVADRTCLLSLIYAGMEYGTANEAADSVITILSNYKNN